MLTDKSTNSSFGVINLPESTFGLLAGQLQLAYKALKLTLEMA